MHSTALTVRQRAAVQAYLRLLQTVRATLDDADGNAAPHSPRGAHQPPALPVHNLSSADPAADAQRPPLVPPSLLADADETLAAAGLAGNEAEFFALLRAWRPDIGTRIN